MGARAGLAAPWDAPLEFRNRYAEEEDPEPPKFVQVPDYRLADDYDPDELLGITHAYAGQVSLWDLCLGAFLDHLAESGLVARTQLTLLSAPVFPWASIFASGHATRRSSAKRFKFRG